MMKFLLTLISVYPLVSPLPQALVTTAIPDSILPSLPDLPPYIDSLHITSNIQLRYARTKVESLVKNPGIEAKKVDFNLVIPESAFISNFSMVTDEGEFVAKVQDKEKAQKTYNLAVNSNQGSGLVSKDLRESNRFQISTNVLGGKKVLFKLNYEELLERKSGVYEHVININPGQVVNDLKIEVFINESLPLTSLSVPELVESNELDFNFDEKENSVAVVTNPVDSDMRNAHIVFHPDKSYQTEAGSQGVSGKMLIKYDVDRSGQESEVQVLDGHFVHYFVPDQLETLAKHAVFVLDVSGSMSGEKLVQMKDAMFTVLDEMTQQDMFSIITFSSWFNHWNPENDIGNPMQATEENKQKAIEYILGLEAGGGTNFNEAILEGIKLTKRALETEALPREVTSMVVFLTDGLPSSGVTNNEIIKNNVRDANKYVEVSIFCIAFGRDADFDLVKQISQQSNSFAKRIYEGSDAALQLEGFYSEISSPLINNLNFTYVGGLVDNTTVSDTKLKTFYQGGEYVITGKLLEPSGNDDRDMLTVLVSGDGKFGKVKRHINICFPIWRPFEHPIHHKFSAKRSIPIRPIDPPVLHPNCTLPDPVYPPRSQDQSFMQNLHAFVNIKQLLKNDDDESRQKALEIALENNFVTELTSLVVVQPDETEPKIAVTEGGLSELDDIFSNSGFGSFKLHAIQAGPVTSQNSPFLRRVVGNKRKRPMASVAAQFYPTTTTGYFAATTPTSRLFTTTYNTINNESFLNSEESVSSSTTVMPIIPECSGNLTLHSKTYYRGDKITLVDLETTVLGSMDNKTVSVTVEGDCCWRLYDGNQLAGESFDVTTGNVYSSVTSLGNLFRKVSSVRKISC